MDILANIDIQTIVVFSVVFLLCYLYFIQTTNLPPGPLRLPLVGNVIWLIQLVFSKDHPHDKIHKDSKKFGDLVYLKFFSQGYLFVNGFDAIHDVLVKKADIFNDRPHWITAELEEILKDGRGVVMQSGEDSKKMRKFALQGLKEFGVGKTSIEEKILSEIEAATKSLYETSGEPYDARRLIILMSSNVINGICFGQRYEYGDRTFEELLKRILCIFERGNPSDISGRLPGFMMKLLGRDKSNERKQSFQSVDYIKKHISQEINKHEESYDANNMRDFVDLYIQNKRADEDKHLYTDGNLFEMILDLFLAGTDTTSNTILWAILYMMEYPDVQKRCQEEIHGNVGNQEIRWSHRTKLPYVEATLMEVQRLANIAPLAVVHTNEREGRVRDFTIPKRTLIFPNLYSSHLDERHWEEPKQFNPERFLQNRQLKKVSAYIPFSIGPRTCVGESLARMEIFLVFCNFLQRFTFKREKDDVPNSFDSPRFQLTTTPLPFKTRVIAREDDAKTLK